GTDAGTRRRAVLHRVSQGFGFFGRRSHEAVRVDTCPALVPRLANLPGHLAPLLQPIARSLNAVHLLAADDGSSIALVLDGPVRPRVREVAEGLVRTAVAQGVVLIEPEGRFEEVGKPVLEAPAPGRPEVLLRLRPDAFAQAHSEGVAVLVERALQLLAPGPEAR